MRERGVGRGWGSTGREEEGDGDLSLRALLRHPTDLHIQWLIWREDQ